jgi:hypothetical protein
MMGNGENTKGSYPLNYNKPLSRRVLHGWGVARDFSQTVGKRLNQAKFLNAMSGSCFLNALSGSCNGCYAKLCGVIMCSRATTAVRGDKKDCLGTLRSHATT